MLRLAALSLALAAFVVALFFFASREPDAPTVAVGDVARHASEARALELTDAPEATATEAAQESVETSDAERAAVVPRSTSIEGDVRTPAGVAVEGAQVGLFAPAIVGDSDASRWAPHPESGVRDDARLVRAWTRSDENGRFRFEDPDPGTWIVRAELGPLLAAATEPFVLVEHASRTDLVVVLPETAWLEGSVIVPDERSLRGVGLELRPKRAPSIAPWSPSPRVEVVTDRCVPDVEGRFRLGPVEAGTHVVGVVIDPAIESRGNVHPFDGFVSPVLEIDLPPGTTERDIDLRGGLPGVIVVRLSVELFDPAQVGVAAEPRDPGSGVLVLARAGDPAVERAFRWNGEHEVECGPLAPGTWRVEFQRSAWRWTLAPALSVAPSDRLVIDRALRVPRTAVLFVDAETGEPLRRTWIQLREEMHATSHLTVTTNDAGKIDLALPPGDYAVTAQRGDFADIALDPKAWSRSTWTEDGPRESVVRLAPPPASERMNTADFRSGRIGRIGGVDAGERGTEFRTGPKR